MGGFNIEFPGRSELDGQCLIHIFFKTVWFKSTKHRRLAPARGFIPGRSKLEKIGIQEAHSIDSIPAEPYEVSDYAGAFYIFTSNVDAHHYDWFLPQEIRECHGNVELYQCAFGRARCGPGIWRAPMDFRFLVDPEKMLALAGEVISDVAG